MVCHRVLCHMNCVIPPGTCRWKDRLYPTRLHIHASPSEERCMQHSADIYPMLSRSDRILSLLDEMYIDSASHGPGMMPDIC